MVMMIVVAVVVVVGFRRSKQALLTGGINQVTVTQQATAREVFDCMDRAEGQHMIRSSYSIDRIFLFIFLSDF